MIIDLVWGGLSLYGMYYTYSAGMWLSFIAWGGMFAYTAVNFIENQLRRKGKYDA